MSKRIVLAAIAMVIVVAPAVADVGPFTSYTTTLTGMPGTIQVDVLLETTGGAASSTDEVFISIYFQNVDDPGSWGFTGDWGHRDGTTNTFPLSYTLTGLIPGHQYKFVTDTDAFTGSWGTATWTAFENARDYIWSSYINPFLASSGSSATFILNYTAQAPTYDGGIFWAANLRSAVASVHQPNLLEVPTLGQWGLLALGGSLLGLGVVALRRSRV